MSMAWLINGLALACVSWAIYELLQARKAHQRIHATLDRITRDHETAEAEYAELREQLRQSIATVGTDADTGAGRVH
jgi:hypothetical protein